MPFEVAQKHAKISEGFVKNAHTCILMLASIFPSSIFNLNINWLIYWESYINSRVLFNLLRK